MDPDNDVLWALLKQVSANEVLYLVDLACSRIKGVLVQVGSYLLSACEAHVDGHVKRAIVADHDCSCLENQRCELLLHISDANTGFGILVVWLSRVWVSRYHF